MADLDAELLALAGDDSEGEESLPTSPQRRSSSPAQEDSPPPISRKPAARGTKKPARRRKDYSDEEEEMSASEGSVAMSESDAEAEFEPEDKPIFAYDKLYHSAADKAEIEAKPELVREGILAERHAQVEKAEQDAQLRRMLAQREKEEAKKTAKKRTASSAELDEQRKSSRQRTKTGASAALAAYKKQREDKAALEERRKSGKASPRRDPLLDDYSDADAEGESDREFEYDDRKRRRRTPSPLPPKDDPIAELADIQKARIGRENFAQVCYTPGFEAALTGCYARVCLGPGRNPGQNEYRLCKINGFQDGRPYAIEGPNHKNILVNKYIVAAHGKATRPWSLLECSNSRFTDDEWRRYRLTMANEDCRMPTQGQITKKLEDINKLINHRFTDFEISQKIKSQQDLVDTVNRTKEKNELKEKIQTAEDAGDEETVRELEDQLLNLVPIKLAFGTSLNSSQAPANKAPSDADRLAELNRRNKQIADQNIQKTAMLKKRLAKKIRESSSQDKLAIPNIKDADDASLFGSDISRAGTPVNGGSRAGTSGLNGTPRSSTPLSMRTGMDTKKGLPVIKKSKRDDTVLQSLDLGIDIDI